LHDNGLHSSRVELRMRQEREAGRRMLRPSVQTRRMRCSSVEFAGRRASRITGVAALRQSDPARMRIGRGLQAALVVRGVLRDGAQASA